MNWPRRPAIVDYGRPRRTELSAMHDAITNGCVVTTRSANLRGVRVLVQRPILLWIGLCTLVIGNLLFDVELFWLAGEDPRGWRLIFQAGIAIFFSQPLLLGIWLGLGDGRWYVRLALGIVLTL